MGAVQNSLGASKTPWVPKTPWVLQNSLGAYIWVPYSVLSANALQPLNEKIKSRTTGARGYEF